MSNLANTRGVFSIPSSVFDEYDWVCDGLLNEVGVTCTLYYPEEKSECTNCYYDNDTQRSSGIYKSGGPQEFTNFTMCPICHGRGLSTLTPTEDITLRVYHNPSSFVDIGVDWSTAQGVVMVIGRLIDLPKIENSTKILLNSDIKGIRRYYVQRQSECVPFGLGQKRYFLGYFERVGGG